MSYESDLMRLRIFVLQHFGGRADKQRCEDMAMQYRSDISRIQADESLAWSSPMVPVMVVGMFAKVHVERRE